MAENLREEAASTLRVLGIEIAAGDLDHWDLKLPEGPLLSRRLRIVDATASLAALRALMDRQGLIVTKKAAPGVIEAARKESIDMIVTGDRSAVLDGCLFSIPDSAVATAKARRGRPAWGKVALIRGLLATHEPLTQADAAALAGTSQQAVSKSFRALHDFLASDDHGARATDRTALLDEWASARHEPGGMSTWWYSLDDPWTQGRAAYKLADELGAEPILGGDLAADVHAPWKLPSTVTIYTRSLVDYADAGFTPAGPGEGTMRAVVPQDTTLWRTAVTEPGGARILDPVATLGDLLAEEGPDSAEAAGRLRAAIAGGTVG